MHQYTNRHHNTSVSDFRHGSDHDYSNNPEACNGQPSRVLHVHGTYNTGLHTRAEFPDFFDSGNAVLTEMKGPMGTQSSQQFPQDFRSLIKIYVTYTRQHTQSSDESLMLL